MHFNGHLEFRNKSGTSSGRSAGTSVLGHSKSRPKLQTRLGPDKFLRHFNVYPIASLSEDEDEQHGARGHHRVGRVFREGRKVDDLKSDSSDIVARRIKIPIFAKP